MPTDAPTEVPTTGATGGATGGAVPDLAGMVGTEFDPTTVLVERGQLRFFARATGQDDPIYHDLNAAHAAGHRDLPVPPTFLFGLGLAQPDTFDWLTDLGIDLRHLLHGEQSFTYHAMAYAGDTLTLTPTITDAYEKKNGALRFITRRIQVDREGTAIATLEEVIIVRDPKARS